MAQATVPKKLKETIGSYGLSNEMFGMYKSGKTVQEIAKHYNMNWQSVKDRLERLAAETGEKVNIKI
jgi:Mor family transcriptional regulator